MTILKSDDPFFAISIPFSQDELRITRSMNILEINVDLIFGSNLNTENTKKDSVYYSRIAFLSATRPPQM